MTEMAVRLEGVGKQYRLGTRRGSNTFWALKDLSFDVEHGGAVGIIGRNGAGKSTLLKLLAGITAPTCGRIVVDGRLAALIEVGSGFHPELTGRENVFLSGAILGMKRRELAEKLPSIVEFAGVEAFIDTPVKWYSSGMYVRLGFSIAAHLQPDILLVDEVLAVGDAEFQLKCLERIQELRRQGVTIIFISHDLTAVEQLCGTAVLLEKGQVVATGDPASVVAAYHRQITSTEVAQGDFPELAREGAIKITNLTFDTPTRPQWISARTGEPLVVSVKFLANRPVDDLLFEIAYDSADGKTTIAAARTDPEQPERVGPPGGTVEFTCPALALKPGAYHVRATVRDARTHHVVDWWDGGTVLHVEPGALGEGQYYMPHTWRIVPSEPALSVRSS